MAFADITLKNAAAANVIFTTYRQGEDVCEWVNRNNLPPSGWTRVILTRKRPSGNGGVTRLQVSVVQPVLDATTGLVKYTNRVNAEYFVPVLGTDQSNQDEHAYVKSFLALSLMDDAAKTGIIPF